MLPRLLLNNDSRTKLFGNYPFFLFLPLFLDIDTGHQISFLQRRVQNGEWWRRSSSGFRKRESRKRLIKIYEDNAFAFEEFENRIVCREIFFFNLSLRSSWEIKLRKREDQIFPIILIPLNIRYFNIRFKLKSNKGTVFELLLCTRFCDIIDFSFYIMVLKI